MGAVALEMRIVHHATSLPEGPRRAAAAGVNRAGKAHGETPMSVKKLREVTAAIFALSLVVVLLAVTAAVFGYRIPGLVKITDALGLGG